MTLRQEDCFRALAGDIADWGERFLRVRAKCGEEAAGQVLGGIAEWLGTDLVDGMPVIALERWNILDALAEELLQGCRASAAGEAGAEERVRRIIARARELA
ncbi:MAG: hypothetical protein PHG20_08495 [Geobacteraceae bacterium]|nr:hypothetical protein [Geobacteraceae bacterium]